MMSCEVFGIPLPTIHWRISDLMNDEATDMGRSFSSNEIASLVETTRALNHSLFKSSVHTSMDGRDIVVSLLNISNIQKEDEGSYICVASNNITNILNTSEAMAISVIVQGKVI